MRFNQEYVRQYFLSLAALLGAFAIFALLASEFLMRGEEAYLVVFFKACTFFGVPLVAFAVIKIFSEDKDSGSGKARQNICLLLALVTIVISGVVFSLTNG